MFRLGADKSALSLTEASLKQFSEQTSKTEVLEGVLPFISVPSLADRPLLVRVSLSYFIQHLPILPISAVAQYCIALTKFVSNMNDSCFVDWPTLDIPFLLKI